MIQDRPQIKNQFFRFLSFAFRHLSLNRGITMLLVVAILSALMSVSLGIFNLIYGQIKISGEIADSFLAFYAADQGIEKTLYLDRIVYINDPYNYPYGICQNSPGAPCYTQTQIPAMSGGCYDLSVIKTTSPPGTEIKVLGQYRCGVNPNRVIKRGFNLTY